MKHIIRFIIFSLIFLTLSSCSDPNIYQNLNLYDPLKEAMGNISINTVNTGETFNLLDITENYEGDIKLNITSEDSYQVLKQLSRRDVSILADVLSYAARYKDIESYISSPLSQEMAGYCKQTKAFANSIITDIQNFMEELFDRVKKYTDVDINSSMIDEFFTSLKKILEPDVDVSSLADYVVIQLTVDVIAYSLDMLVTIAIDMPSDLVNDLWENIEKEDFWTEAEGSIKENAASLISQLIDMASEIDLIGSNIPSFIDLTTIAGEFL